MHEGTLLVAFFLVCCVHLRFVVCVAGAGQGVSVKILQPENAGRLWIDEEHPAVIEVCVCLCCVCLCNIPIFPI